MPVGDEVHIQNHPELNDALSTYDKIEDFLSGDIKRVKKHLIPYPLESGIGQAAATSEGALHFSLRGQRAYHKPIQGPALEIHKGHLDQSVNWKGWPDDLDYILEDVTGLDKPAEDFLLDMISERLSLGRVGVLVDGPQIENRGTSADDKIEGNRSYQILYKAYQIKFWKFETRGELRGKLTNLVLTDKPEYTEDGKSIQKLRRFFFEPGAENFTFQVLRELEISEEDTKKTGNAAKKVNEPDRWEVIEEGQSELKEIPFVMWGDGLCDSLFKETWQLESASFNLNSVVSNVIYKQGMDRTYLFGAKDGEAKSVNESQIVRISNPDGKVVNITPVAPEAAFTEIKLVDSRAQRIAMLQHNQLLDDTRQVQSAESKEKDMKGRERYYEKTIEQVERKLNRIYRFHLLFEGKDSLIEGLAITLGRDFGLTSEDTEIKERNSLALMAKTGGVTSVYKEVLKTAVSRTTFTVTSVDDSLEELKDRLYQDIDNMKDFNSGPTGGLLSAQRPSIADQTRAPAQNGNQ